MYKPKRGQSQQHLRVSFVILSGSYSFCCIQSFWIQQNHFFKNSAGKLHPEDCLDEVRRFVYPGKSSALLSGKVHQTESKEWARKTPIQSPEIIACRFNMGISSSCKQMQVKNGNLQTF